MSKVIFDPDGPFAFDSSAEPGSRTVKPEPRTTVPPGTGVAVGAPDASGVGVLSVEAVLPVEAVGVASGVTPIGRSPLEDGMGLLSLPQAPRVPAARARASAARTRAPAVM